MKLNRILFLLSTALLCSTSVVMAEPTVKENYHYYTVEPKSSKDLQAALDRATPINENGKKFHAYTHWDLHWTFHFWTANGSCVVQQANTTVDVDYTFPQLANTVKDEATLTAFQRYVLALKEHEHGHEKNGLNAANEVEDALIKISASNCPATEKLANEKGQEILQKYNQQDRDYDKQTQHGKTQGAIL